MTDDGRFLVVRLEKDLHPSRVVGIFCAFRQIPGVVSVTDLSAISAETLDVMLRAPEPVVVQRTVRTKQLELGA
jgi:hypothetical protein